MPNDDTHKPPEADDIAPKSAPLRWLWKFNHGLDIVKGTVGGYRAEQPCGRLSSVPQRLSGQGEQPGQGRHGAATATFTEILARILRSAGPAANPVFRFHPRRPRQIDESDQALATKNARAISEHYEKARIALRENIDVLTRKAEVYIDWASDTWRDPADKRNVDGDPLSRQVLRDYAFDCSDKYNFPAFGNVNRRGRRHAHQAGRRQRILRNRRETGRRRHDQAERCLRPDLRRSQRQGRQAHLLVQRQTPRPDDALLPRGHARTGWRRRGSGPPGATATPRRKARSSGEKRLSTPNFDDLAGRINAFSSLALYQMSKFG
jgi:hypothetical protein